MTIQPAPVIPARMPVAAVLWGPSPFPLLLQATRLKPVGVGPKMSEAGSIDGWQRVIAPRVSCDQETIRPRDPSGPAKTRGPSAGAMTTPQTRVRSVLSRPVET